MADTPSILISYRRDDSAPWAGRLYDQLSRDFGQSHVFMDIDSIQPGVDFEKVLQSRMSSCNVCLPVIGRGWVDARLDGRRRLDDPTDFVRREIEAALQRGAQIIPILVDGAAMPAASDLPDSLKPLAAAQPANLTHQGFRSDVNALLVAVQKDREAKLTPSGAGLVIAGAYAVVAPLAVERLGDEVASRFFDFGRAGMDLAEGISGKLVVFVITWCLGYVLMSLRATNLTGQERTLFRVGFVLLIAALIPEVFRVFVFAFSGYGLAHWSFLIGYGGACLFGFGGMYVVFRKRGSDLAHVEWIVACMAIFGWVYLTSSFAFLVVVQNFFADLDRDFEQPFQIATGAVAAAAVAILAILVSRSQRSAVA